VVHGFARDPDGTIPYYALLPATAGNLYGTTVQGGVSNQGAIFRFMPWPLRDRNAGLRNPVAFG